MKPVKWPGDVVTKINEAVRDKKWEAETEYFKLKWYKVGTLHIEFKRMDLVAKMNALAGAKERRASDESTARTRSSLRPPGIRLMDGL